LDRGCGSSAGYPGWQLRTDAADQCRRCQSQDTEASAPDLRDGDHRTLPPAGELGRGSADRDVSGGHFSQAGGTSPAAHFAQTTGGRRKEPLFRPDSSTRRSARMAAGVVEARGNEVLPSSRMLPSVIGGPAGCLGLFDDVVGARKAVSDLALRWEDAAGRGLLPSPTASGWLPTLS
jgi:hypothetical protein